MVERAGEVSWMSRQGQLRRNTTSALTQGPEGPDCGLMLCRRVLEICILFEQGSLHHPFVSGLAVVWLAWSVSARAFHGGISASTFTKQGC